MFTNSFNQTNQMEYIQTQLFNLESAVLSIAVLVAKIATIWLLIQGMFTSLVIKWDIAENTNYIS